MIAREWKATCPKKYHQDFLEYLHKTGVKDSSNTKGFLGLQILNRDLDDVVEITFFTYWESLDCIRSFAGEDISLAKLYPEDAKYELKPDKQVNHYQVYENNYGQSVLSREPEQTHTGPQVISNGYD